MRERPRLPNLIAPVLLLAGLAWVTPCSRGQTAPEDFEMRRATMIREIEDDVRATRREIGKDALDPRVMAAMASVPRHEFVPEDLRADAYLNRPLPIGRGQTISQPYIVALMSDLLQLGAGARVLDIGTGSGYQAAILARLAAHVVSIEIIPELGQQAAARLARLGFENVEVRIGDGYYGWPEKAPFDGIVVAAAIAEIPQPLIDQLKPGGRLVLPHGDPARHQDLVVIHKLDNGALERQTIIPVRFVPLVGDH